MTAVNGDFGMSVISQFGNALYQSGRILERMGRDLADVNKLVIHAKAVEALYSVSETFFATQMPLADNFKGALKTLKGWTALGSLPTQIMNTAGAVYRFVNQATFSSFQAVVRDGSVAINKMYDAASFLEKQIAMPFFKGVSETYKTTHFGALVAGSLCRFSTALDNIYDYKGSVSVTGSLKVIESASSAVFATAVLMGGSNQLTVAANAVATFSKGLEYYVNCLQFS